MGNKMKKPNVVNFREAAAAIRNRHNPGKLMGLYRSLRKSHTASEEGGWASASMLTATVLNQMIRSGSKLWWDLLDLELGVLTSPDSMRDEIGIRTLAGKIEKGTDSPSFVSIVAFRNDTGVRPDDLHTLPCEEVNEMITGALIALGVPTGGLMPMLAHMGDAAREANLIVHRIGTDQGSIRIQLWDPAEEGHYTQYVVRIETVNLLKDMDLIRSSLSSRQG
jgi:hypothetical protein